MMPARGPQTVFLCNHLIFVRCRKQQTYGISCTHYKTASTTRQHPLYIYICIYIHIWSPRKAGGSSPPSPSQHDCRWHRCRCRVARPRRPAIADGTVAGAAGAAADAAVARRCRRCSGAAGNGRCRYIYVYIHVCICTHTYMYIYVHTWSPRKAGGSSPPSPSQHNCRRHRCGGCGCGGGGRGGVAAAVW